MKENKVQPITTINRNCLTKLYLDNKVMEVIIIHLFAVVVHQLKKEPLHNSNIWVLPTTGKR